MSSTKKRKKDRACDPCRRKKIKCDGPWAEGNICTNCTQARKECTYVEVSTPRGPPKAYVTGLEDRLKALEDLLQQIHPGVDFSDELGPPVVRDSWKRSHEFRPVAPSSTQLLLVSPYPQPRNASPPNPLVSLSTRTTHLVFTPHLRPKKPESRSNPKQASDQEGFSLSEEDFTTELSSTSDDDVEETVATSIHGRAKISLLGIEPDDKTDNSLRFHGRSSTAGLVEVARKFKYLHRRETVKALQQEDSSPRNNPPVVQMRRPMYWEIAHWEYYYQGSCVDPATVLLAFIECFPPMDLAESLINIYFHRSNAVFPLLHRPTFLRQWEERLQYRNIWFAGVCFAMFAVASRWSDDQRVVPLSARTEDGQPDWRRGGLHYFEMSVEVHRVPRGLFHSASLFEVQSFTLMGMYLRGTSTYPEAWLHVSVGMRKALDVGAHRKKVYGLEVNKDNELWKRAFWHLVVFDRIGGASLGRACGMAEEDFDVELPLEVDDEYWEGEQDVQEPFKQPSGKPSYITAFNQFIKLTQIMAFTVRTLYSVNKSELFHSLIPMRREDVVKQLSSAMDEWRRALPHYLKWNDTINDPLIATQSAMLATTFEMTRMLVYRSLIPTSFSRVSPGSSDRPPPTSSPTDPSVVICMDATRSCAEILEVGLTQGCEYYHMPNVINVAYVCAGLLLVSIWNLRVNEQEFKKKGIEGAKPLLTQQIDEYNADVQIFLRALDQGRHRWGIVGPLLEELEASFPELRSGNMSNYSNSPEVTPSINASLAVPCSLSAPPPDPFPTWASCMQQEYVQVNLPASSALSLNPSASEHTRIGFAQNTLDLGYRPKVSWPPCAPCVHPSSPDKAGAISGTAIPIPLASQEHDPSYINNSLQHASLSALLSRDLSTCDWDEVGLKSGQALPASSLIPIGNSKNIEGENINAHPVNAVVHDSNLCHSYYSSEQSSPNSDLWSKSGVIVGSNMYRMEDWCDLTSRVTRHPGLNGWSANLPETTINDYPDPDPSTGGR